MLTLTLANTAQAIPMVVKTLDAGLCWGVFPIDHLDHCYSQSYVDILDMGQYQNSKQLMRAAYEERITFLEKLLISYKAQLANSHNDVVDTLISDPQFRSMIIQKIKKDLNLNK